MTSIVQQVHAVAEQHPALNWLVITGSAALAWIQPLAGIIAIVWGCLQIYLAVEKRWFRRKP